MENETHLRQSEHNLVHDLGGTGGSMIRIKTEKDDEEFHEIKVKVEKLEENCDPSIRSSSLPDDKMEIKDISEWNESARVWLQYVKLPEEDTSGIEVLLGVSSIKKECEQKVGIFDDSSDNNDFKCDIDCKDFIPEIVPKELNLDSKQCVSRDAGSSDSKAKDKIEDTSNVLDPALKMNTSRESSAHALSNVAEKVLKKLNNDHSLKDQETSDQNELERHIVEAHRKLEFQCHLCDNRYSRNTHLARHIDSVHFNIKPFKCHLCGSLFARKFILNRHINNIHLNVKTVECHMCKYSTLYQAHLTAHIDSVHHNEKEFACHLCESRFEQKTHLSRHIERVHLNKKKFQCQMCEYSYSVKSHLTVHINSVHINSKKYECHLCDYRTSSQSHLTAHIDSVHLNGNKFRCHLCLSRFASKSDIEHHIIRIHLNKKFQCRMCEFSFSTKNNLEFHCDRIHRNVKRFECHLCKYRYSKKAHLMMHINSVHFKLKKLRKPIDTD